MVGHVSSRPTDRIALGAAPQKPPQPSQKVLQPMIPRPPAKVHLAQFEKIINIAVLDGEATVHEGLAECDIWVEKQSSLCGAVVQPYCDSGSRLASLEDGSLAAASVNGEFTSLDNTVEKPS